MRSRTIRSGDFADGANGLIASPGDVDFDVALPFERVFDKPGNILFVFHDENTSTHRATLVIAGFHHVTGPLNLGYEVGFTES